MMFLTGICRIFNHSRSFTPATLIPGIGAHASININPVVIIIDFKEIMSDIIFNWKTYWQQSRRLILKSIITIFFKQGNL